MLGKLSCLEIGIYTCNEVSTFLSTCCTWLHMKIETNQCSNSKSNHFRTHFPWKAILFSIYIMIFNASAQKKTTSKNSHQRFGFAGLGPQNVPIIWQFPPSGAKEWFLRSTPRPGSPSMSYVPDNINRSIHICNETPKFLLPVLTEPAPNQPLPHCPNLQKSIDSYY